MASGAGPWLIAAGLLALWGPIYKEPAASEPTATLQFTKRDFFTSNLWIFKADDCRDGAVFPKGFAAWDMGSRTYRVPVGERVYLRPRSNSGSTRYRQTCHSLLSFVPEAGRVYELTVEMPADYCSASLVDKATGGEPRDLRKHALVRRCT